MSSIHAPIHKIQIGNVGVIAGIFIIAGVISGLMYMSAYILPLIHSDVSYGIVSFAIIALGLAAPYWMLKLIMHEAHLRDSREKELQLTDIPKDKQELDNEQQTNWASSDLSRTQSPM